MPYIKHTDGFESAHANHNATNSTLGGFDQLIRCRGHYPDAAPCDDVLYAHVPDEDVCENCTVVTEEEYDDFHSARTVHIFEHHFVPALETKLNSALTHHADATANSVLLTREMNSDDDEAVLAASELLPKLRASRRWMGERAVQLEAHLEASRRELEQAKKDLATPGDSVRKRRLRTEQ